MARNILSPYSNYAIKRKKAREQVKSDRNIAHASEDRKKGDLLDNAAYALSSLGTGVASVGEGVIDLLGAGGDLITGNKQKAKSRFLDNKVADWREDLRNDLKPGAVGSFLGDAFQGVGQSAYFLLDAAAPGLGTGLFFTGIGSQGVSSAAAKTGDVGVREIAYGTLSGGLEAATEKVIGAGGQAARKLYGSAARRITGKAATEATKRAGKSLNRVIIGDVLKSMAGEAAEEGFSELIDPALQRWTGVDKNAPASFGDVLYSMGVGALSGGLMATPATLVNHKANERRGRTIHSKGKTEETVRTARITLDTVKSSLEGSKKGKERMEAERKAAKTPDKAQKTAGEPTVGNASDGSQEATTGATDASRSTLRKLKKEVKRAEQFAEALDKNLKAWDAMNPAQQQSASGMDLLGEISTNLTFYEFNGVLDDHAEAILSMADEELTPIVEKVNAMAHEKGYKVTYTMEDIRQDRDGILYQMAARRALEEFEMGETEADPTQTKPTEKPADEKPDPSAPETTAEDNRAFDKLAKRHGIPKGIVQQMKDDYRQYGESVEENLFALSYYTEMHRARTGMGTAGYMTEYLPEAAAQNARKIGQALARADRRTDAETAPKADAPAKSSENTIRSKAKKAPARRVHNRTGMNRKQMTEVQRAVYDTCEVLAEVMNTEITLFASRNRKGTREMFESGKWVKAPFGWFDAQGHIHIDINAEFDGKNVALLTLAHESVHFIKRYAPEDFRRIGETVVTLLPVSDADIKEMVDLKQTELEARGRLKELSEAEAYDYAFEEVVADAMETVLSDGLVLEKLILDSRHGQEKNVWKKLLEHLDKLIHRLKELMRGVRAPHGAGRMLAEVKDSMRGVRDIYAQALTNAGEARRQAGSRMNSEKMHNTDSRTDGNLRESVRPERINFEGESDESESKAIIRIIHENAEAISDQATFDVTYTGEAEAYAKKSEYIQMVFDEQSNTAVNPTIGRVELKKSGAKSTIAHGYGHVKLAAVRALKTVIENGHIVSFVQNYKNTGVDRYVIAAKGQINGEATYIGVVIKSYPQNKSDSKFYLHEAEIIKADTPIMTAPQLSVDTVSASAYENSIAQNRPTVNPAGENNSGNRYSDRPDAESATPDDESGERFQSQLDDWMSGIMPENGYFDIGQTPASLLSSGAKPLPMIMNEHVIYKFTTDYGHEVSVDEIKRLPEELADPVMVFKGSVDDSMVVLTEMKDKSGDSVIVAIHMNRHQKRMLVNRIASIYGKNRVENYVESNINAGNLLYASKTKAPVWFTNRGLQLPKLVQTITDADNSIPQNPPAVNPTGENNSGNRYSDRPDAFTAALQRNGIGTDRYLLARALEDAVANEQEYRLLKEYKSNLGTLDGFVKELSSVKDELKKMYFAKGKRDGEALKKLQEREKQLTDEISKRDEKLLSLEAAKPLRDILEREKKKAHKKGKEEAEDKGRERKQKTDALNKRRIIVEIADRWLTLVEKPTKTRNIPKAMEPLVLDVLSCIHFDPKDAERMIKEMSGKIAEEKASELPDLDRIEKWEKAIQRIRDVEKHNAAFAERVAALYGRMAKHEDPTVRLSYDQAVEEKIGEMAQIIGDKTLDQLTYEELQEVRKTIDMMVHTITESKKLFVSDQKQSVSDTSVRIQEELAERIEKHKSRKPLPGTDGRTPTFVKFWKGAYINELKPIYFFDEIESPTLRKLFNNLHTRSERTFARDLLEIRAFRERIDKEFKVKSWDRESRKSFKIMKKNSKTGEWEPSTVKLNLGQIMAIYAYSKRSQAVGHLLTGGFCLDPREDESIKIKGKIPTPIKTTIDDAVTYKPDETQMWKIAEALTDEQRAYVDEMVRFLSSDMAKKGNEVSMKLYGVELFNEEFYFPIQTKSAYRAVQNNQSKGDPMLKSMGMTKSTVPNARNPLVLSDFDAVWGKHCSDMTSYHALVLPIEDLRRVFEYGSTDSEVGASSTKGAIINAYGEAAERYISTLLTDLNGGLRRDPTGSPTSKLISLMKKSRVMASLSVAIQQPMAMVRAMALVDPKYFPSTAPLKGGKAFTEQWEKLMKYADTAVIKDIGFFDVGMGRRVADWINAPTYEGIKEKGLALVKDGDYRDEALGWLPSTADKWAWMSIWGAVENEIAATTELARGSEEFYRAVGERFDEVVRRTQVYDSMLSRSAFMRSKSEINQMATAFMAEPTTTVNMIIMGIKQMAKGDKKRGTRTLGVVYLSMLLTTVASSLVYAMRDDDENETYGEKLVESVGEQIRPWTMFPNLLPFVRDAVSLMEGYDIQRTDMTVIGDAVNAFRTLQSDKKTWDQKAEAAAGSIGTLFGLPVRNVWRDLRAIKNTVGNAGNNATPDLMYAFQRGFFGKEVSDGQRLYELRMDGNTIQSDRVTKQFETEEKAAAALRKALRDNDPRIEAAADARMAGNAKESIRIRKEIVAEGHFTDDEVLRAINSEVNAIKKLEEEET